MADVIKIDQRLAIAVYGTTNLTEVDRDNPDGDEIEEHPVAKYLEKVRFDKSMEQNSSRLANTVWDEVIGAVQKKSDEQPPEIGTLAKKLGIVRSEVVDIAGVRWARGYDSEGQLVSARVLC